MACGGGFQAPVTEQGERQVLTAPIIVDGNTPDSLLNVPTVTGSVSSSRSSPPRRPVTVSRSSSQLPATTGAVGGSRSNTSVSASHRVANHRVTNGDTLFSIAFQYDLDFRRLAIANGLRAPYTIFVGQVINLDLSRISNSGSVAGSTSVGTRVSNNAIGSTQGASRSGGVLRQPIGASTQEVEPDWQWPHSGGILQRFQAGVNKGIDIGGRIGDPVYAASEGEVVYSGSGIRGTGDLIILRHSDRYLSAYAHNSVMLVDLGNRVRAGEKIAELGQSPNGVALLHFEIRLDGVSVDPSKFLPRR